MKDLRISEIEKLDTLIEKEGNKLGIIREEIKELEKVIKYNERFGKKYQEKVEPLGKSESWDRYNYFNTEIISRMETIKEEAEGDEITINNEVERLWYLRADLDRDYDNYDFNKSDFINYFNEENQEKRIKEWKRA